MTETEARAKNKGEPVPAFAEQVRAARAKLGLGQNEVARRAGCGNSTVAEIENGHRSPSLSLAARLAAVLGLRMRLADLAPPTPPAG